MIINTDKISVEISQKEMRYFKLSNSTSIKDFIETIMPLDDEDNDEEIGFKPKK